MLPWENYELWGWEDCLVKLRLARSTTVQQVLLGKGIREAYFCIISQVIASFFGGELLVLFGFV
jgi:hypothetical protein